MKKLISLNYRFHPFRCPSYFIVFWLGFIGLTGLLCQCTPPAAPMASLNDSVATDSEARKPLKMFLDTITTPIDGPLAILIAEAWVAEQGYTDKKYAADNNKRQLPIQFEKGEFATDTGKIVALRFNTLQAQAVGAREYGDRGGKWLVGFRYIHPENNIVRAVTMDSLARTIVIQMQDVREDWILGSE